MSKKNMLRMEVRLDLKEIREGAKKYILAFINLNKELDESDLKKIGAEAVYLGYAMGVIGAAYNERGVEGYSMMLNAMNIAIHAEKRKEAIMFAVWDKYGNLYTSDEGFKQEGGES